jgi:hypothetical protein
MAVDELRDSVGKLATGFGQGATDDDELWVERIAERGHSATDPMPGLAHYSSSADVSVIQQSGQLR